MATPINWDELADLKSANSFHIPDILERIENGADPWQDVAKIRQSLTKTILGKIGVNEAD
ncbi:ATP-dependent DNA ligase [compost metagenome]